MNKNCKKIWPQTNKYFSYSSKEVRNLYFGKIPNENTTYREDNKEEKV